MQVIYKHSLFLYFSSFIYFIFQYVKNADPCHHDSRNVSVWHVETLSCILDTFHPSFALLARGKGSINLKLLPWFLKTSLRTSKRYDAKSYTELGIARPQPHCDEDNLAGLCIDSISRTLNWNECLLGSSALTVRWRKLSLQGTIWFELFMSSLKLNDVYIKQMLINTMFIPFRIVISGSNLW